MIAPNWIESEYGQKTYLAILDFLDHADMARIVVEKGVEALDDLTVRLALEAIARRLGESVVRMNSRFLTDYPNLLLREIRDTRGLEPVNAHFEPQ